MKPVILTFLDESNELYLQCGSESLRVEMTVQTNRDCSAILSNYATMRIAKFLLNAVEVIN